MPDPHARPRIALLGIFGAGNLGNEGSLRAALDQARRLRPGAEFLVIAYDPERVTAEHGVRAVRLVRKPLPPSTFTGLLARAWRLVFRRAPAEVVSWVQVIQTTLRLDLILVPGTGILDDFGVTPFGPPYGLFKWGLAAKLCRTPVRYLSVGAGPIHHPRSRWFMQTALRWADYRSFRDTYSRDYAQGIGCDVRGDSISPDIVFTLPSTAQVPHVPRTPLTVGVGLMTYHGWSNQPDHDGEATYQDYLRKVTPLVLWLLDQGYEVRVLLGELTDRRAADDVVAALARARPADVCARLHCPTIRSMADVLEAIAATDYVVTTRFHNIVAALIQHRPVISLGYAVKNDELMRVAGLGDFCQHIDRFDLALLQHQFARLVAEGATHRARIAAMQEDFRRRAHDQLASCLDA